MSIARWAVYLLAAVSTAAGAHEFWIDPVQFRVDAGERIAADLRVGQQFKGDALVYLPSRIVRFSVIGPDGTRPVDGTIGDQPAASIETGPEGLYVLAYQSTSSQVTYDDMAEFEGFLRTHGLEWVKAAHRERGLSETDIKEAFSRYAKSLVAVGDGAGNDRVVGLPLELVAETNPYRQPPGDGVTVRFLWRGEPMADAEIHVFYKPAGCDVTRTEVMTDDDGRARVPAGPGGRILVNAVHMKEATRMELLDTGAVWHSLWASLTFELPEPTSGAGCEG